MLTDPYDLDKFNVFSAPIHPPANPEFPHSFERHVQFRWVWQVFDCDSMNPHELLFSFTNHPPNAPSSKGLQHFWQYANPAMNE